MSISGSFISGNATRQPMATNEPPVARHGAKTMPDNNWSDPPLQSGSGYPDDAARIAPEMYGRGFINDLAHRFGHAGTERTRNAKRARFVSQLLGYRTDAQTVIQGAASDASAAAHGDRQAAFYPGHVYDPKVADSYGVSYTLDRAEGGAAPMISGRVIAKTQGHGFPDGPLDAMYAPTGFRLGVSRRFAVAHYSSPTIGAMYSKNTLRGVLPQIVATPYNQPAQSGAGAGKAGSGIASNQRHLMTAFASPKLFRSPPSESDTMVAVDSMPGMGPTIGMGF